MSLIEPFFTKYTKAECKKVYRIYQGFIQTTNELNNFYTSAKKVQSDIEMLKVPSESVLEAMEERIPF